MLVSHNGTRFVSAHTPQFGAVPAIPHRTRARDPTWSAKETQEAQSTEISTKLSEKVSEFSDQVNQTLCPVSRGDGFRGGAMGRVGRHRCGERWAVETEGRGDAA